MRSTYLLIVEARICSEFFRKNSVLPQEAHICFSELLGEKSVPTKSTNLLCVGAQICFRENLSKKGKTQPVLLKKMENRNCTFGSSFFFRFLHSFFFAQTNCFLFYVFVLYFCFFVKKSTLKSINMRSSFEDLDTRNQTLKTVRHLDVRFKR